MTPDAEKEALNAFKQAVNMTARQITAWLEMAESKEVGSKETDGAESVGHRSGKQIVRILGKKAAAHTAADFTHMAKVAAYVKRHLAQRPEGDVTHTRWRYSLMNWGHDPQKKRGV